MLPTVDAVIDKEVHVKGSVVATLAIAVAAFSLVSPAGALAAPSDPQPSASPDAEWVETTFKRGKVVSVRRGTGEPPDAGRVDKDLSPITATTDPKLAPSVGGVGAESAEGGEADWGNCKEVRAARVGRTFFGWVAYKFWHWNFFCWSYPAITYYDAGYYFTDVDSNFLVRDVWGGGHWYEWRGHPHGGHTSYRQAMVENCILHYGCLGAEYPWVRLWINGNGAWAYDTGGT